MPTLVVRFFVHVGARRETRSAFERALNFSCLARLPSLDQVIDGLVFLGLPFLFYPLTVRFPFVQSLGDPLL